MCVHTCMYVCMYLYTYLYNTHMYTWTCTHIYIHPCTFIIICMDMYIIIIRTTETNHESSLPYPTCKPSASLPRKPTISRPPATRTEASCPLTAPAGRQPLRIVRGAARKHTAMQVGRMCIRPDGADSADGLFGLEQRATTRAWMTVGHPPVRRHDSHGWSGSDERQFQQLI